MGGVFAGKHRVWLGACCHKNGAGGPGDGGIAAACVRPAALVATDLARERDGARCALLVNINGTRINTFSEADALFQRLLHLFMVEGVGGAVDHALAVGERDAAPLLEELDDTRFATLRPGCRTLGTDGACVSKELSGEFAL